MKTSDNADVMLGQVTDMRQLIDWRLEVIADVFGVDADDTVLASTCEYYRRHIAEDTHYAVVASVDGCEAGCGAICLTDELPSPDNPTGKCAYLMNIYVRNQFRHRGLGRRIVDNLIEEARRSGCCKIYLETTDGARHLYRSAGFCRMPDMMILKDEREG